jgi:hypothetical protein
MHQLHPCVVDFWMENEGTRSDTRWTAGTFYKLDLVVFSNSTKNPLQYHRLSLLTPVVQDPLLSRRIPRISYPSASKRQNRRRISLEHSKCSLFHIKY